MEPYDDAVVLSQQKTFGGTEVPKGSEIILIEEIEADLWLCEYQIEDPSVTTGVRYDWFKVAASEVATLKLGDFE